MFVLFFRLLWHFPGPVVGASGLTIYTALDHVPAGITWPCSSEWIDCGSSWYAQFGGGFLLSNLKTHDGNLRHWVLSSTRSSATFHSCQSHPEVSTVHFQEARMGLNWAPSLYGQRKREGLIAVIDIRCLSPATQEKGKLIYCSYSIFNSYSTTKPPRPFYYVVKVNDFPARSILQPGKETEFLIKICW